MPGTSTPCASNTAGSLSGGNSQYTATYSYDNLDRLTSGPANGGSSYTYGDSAHLHAATSTSGGYSASYDAAGNMTCRAPTSSATCTGSSPSGAGLSYDSEGQLVGWTSALTGSPTASTAAFAYDGEGARVALKTTTGTGIVTTTDYLLGGLEEQQTVGGSVRPSSTLTEYYPLPGIGTAVRVTTSSSSTLSYLAGDQLGSVSVALSTSGTVTAQALYRPYGTVRYSSGTMPTAHGYTGQLADGMTGLDYYGARYYDPALGQFAQADSVLDGLNRYAYVGGNPESAIDPSGHEEAAFDAPGAFGGWANGSNEGGGGGGGAAAGAVGAAVAYALDEELAGDSAAAGAGAAGAGAAGAGAAGGASGPGSSITYVTEIDGYQVTVTNDGTTATEVYDDQVSGGKGPLTGTTSLVDGSTDPGITGSDDPNSAFDGQHGYRQQMQAADQDPNGNPPTPPKPTGPSGLPPTDPTSTEPTSTEGNGNPEDGCGESFAPATPVATPQGERPIATLAVGDQVEAYDPTTDTTSVQTVQHVFIDRDTDLIDVTLRPVQSAESVRRQAGRLADGSGRGDQRQSQRLRPRQQAGEAQDEVVHTTASHPWLTANRGWQRAGALYVGEQVVTADGSTAVVVALHVVFSTANMWDLTVSNVHTFVVGAGAYVVHNCAQQGPSFPTNQSQLSHIFRNSAGHLADDTPANRALLQSAASNPANFAGTDQWGKVWYAQLQGDGSQVWVTVRGGMITNGGVNTVPYVWDPVNGLVPGP